MTEFKQHFHSRGFLGVFQAVAATVLATVFIFQYDSPSPVFLGIGIVSAVIAFLAWRSVKEASAWRMQICSRVLSCSTSGNRQQDSSSVELDKVSRAVVDDRSNLLHLCLRNGQEVKIHLAVSGYGLHRHLSEHYPEITSVYIAREFTT